MRRVCGRRPPLRLVNLNLPPTDMHFCYGRAHTSMCGPYIHTSDELTLTHIEARAPVVNSPGAASISPLPPTPLIMCARTVGRARIPGTRMCSMCVREAVLPSPGVRKLFSVACVGCVGRWVWGDGCGAMGVGREFVTPAHKATTQRQHMHANARPHREGEKVRIGLLEGGRGGYTGIWA